MQLGAMIRLNPAVSLASPSTTQQRGNMETFGILLYVGYKFLASIPRTNRIATWRMVSFISLALTGSAFTLARQSAFSPVSNAQSASSPSQAVPPAAPQSTPLQPGAPPGGNPQQATAPPPTSGLNIVVLDPAHGGTDFGARGTGGIHESDIVLEFAAQVRAALESHGFQVIQTRRGSIERHRGRPR